MNVDLKGIIRDNKLDRNSIAAMLFPKLKYPLKGLQGVHQGRELTASQLLTLSRFMGVKVDDLYTEQGVTVKRVLGDVVFSLPEGREAHYYVEEARLVINGEKGPEEFLVPSKFYTVPQIIEYTNFLLKK